ncbi:hypothetical protein V6N13_021922 [Hibiscus sabdariffa]|uniref:glutathione transferase n=1 Tax=Hibiscus sabdariffa TaxID=183260 RepID=A0ABR2CQ37_9ROSI
MAIVKVHGYPLSNATQRVLACLYEKDVEFEFVNIHLGAGEHKSETFLALNPFGQIPALEQGDLKLFESRAITQYIAQEYSDKGTHLLPVPGSNKTMALVQLWKEVETHQFEPPSTNLVRELCLKPFFGMTTDTAVVEENQGKLAKVLDVYEARLAQSKYLACEQFTLVDLHHLPNVQYLMRTEVKKLFDSRPHVSAWVADITARPAWSKVLDLQKPEQ